MRTKDPILEEALLDMLVALCDEVVPSLRAVVVDIDPIRKKRFYSFYYDCEVDDVLFDLASVAACEASCGSFAFYEEEELIIKRLDYPSPIPVRGALAYLRKEPTLVLKQEPRAIEIESPLDPIPNFTHEERKEEFSMLWEVPLSVQRALLGKVVPQLREVSIEINKEKKMIGLFFVYDCEVSTELHDLATAAMAEVAADFPDYSVNKSIEYVPYPKRVLFKGYRVVYYRNEGRLDNKLVCYENTKDPLLGKALLGMLVALCNAVVPSLRAVVVDIDPIRKKRFYSFYYDCDVDDELFNLASVAAREASSSFAFYEEEELIIKRLDYPNLIPVKGALAYLRKEPLLMVKQEPRGVETESKKSFWDSALNFIPRFKEEKKEKFSMLDKVPLSVQRALLGKVVPQLRSVSIDFNEQKKIIDLFFVYDCELDIELSALASAATVEVGSNFPAYRVNKSIESVPFPQQITYKGKRSVYNRKELGI